MQLLRPRGFILLSAMAIMFVMLLFSLILANQGRAVHGFTMITQGDTLDNECALFAFADLRGILEGELAPATLGLPSTLASTNSFSGVTNGGDATFDGKLTYQKPSGPGGPDSYTSTVAAAAISGLNVPTDHSAAQLTSSIPNQPEIVKQRYATVYSSHCAFGLLAPSGSIQVKSVRSSGDVDGADSNVIGLMANLFSSGSINVSGQLNGRAYSSGGSISVSQGGILYPSWPNAVSIPADFNSQLSTFKSQVLSGLSSSLNDKFDHLHGCLHEDFSSAAGEALAAAEATCGTEGGTLDSPYDTYGGADTTQATVSSPSSTDYDNSGGTLTIGTSLRIPSGENDELTFSTINISGDLLLEDNTVLHCTGDVTVSGAIRLGQKATLVVDGQTQANEVDPTYSVSGTTDVSIRSTMWGKGAINISGGMSQASITWVPNLPTPNSSCPYPENLTFSCLVANDPAYDVPGQCQNPACIDYEARMTACMTQLTVTDQVQNNLVTIVPSGVPTTDSVPGVFIIGDQTINLGGGSKASGLFFANNGVTVGASKMVGAVWVASGNVSLSAADYRYFSYFTHAFPHTASGELTVAAVDHHPIAFGKLP